MKVNEGAIDRTIRVIIGLFLLSLIFWGPKSLWGLDQQVSPTASFSL